MSKHKHKRRWQKDWQADVAKSQLRVKPGNILFDNDKEGLVKIYKDCPECAKGREETLTMPWEIWQKWLCISSNMGNLEWGAIFSVENVVVNDADSPTITAFKIPKQEVTGGSCKLLIEVEDLGDNGMVHSHHSMGAFHSGIDDATERNLFDYSIVLSGEKYEACRKIKLACGAYTYVPVKLVFTAMPDVDLTNIQEKKTVVYQTGGFFYGRGEDYGEGYQEFGDLSHFNRRERSCTGCQEKDCTGCPVAGLE